MLSIITNFGCHYKCPECIVKNNKLQIPKTTVEGLRNLHTHICFGGEISISGGGDPLYSYEENLHYYTTLFKILDKNKCKLEMHTTFTNSQFPYWKCSRVVYHLHLGDSLENIIKHKNEIVRVVYVIDKNYSKNDLLQIYDKVKNSKNIDELTFRQYVDNNYITRNYLHDDLLSGHNKGLWHYVVQCDYNDYYVNGRIFKKFREITNC